MRKNQYILSEEMRPDTFLYYNSFSDQFLIMNQVKHDYFERGEFNNIEKEYPELFQVLISGEFLVPDDFDEFAITLHRKNEMQMDASFYHIMINTTLDCNLNCWYCYENKIIGSKLTSDIIEAIKKNVELEYHCSRFNMLKISFFGGEPFMGFDSIRTLLDFIQLFCQEKGIGLIADFTTNATLITKDHIDYLKKYRCHFQITLDGDRKVHNKVKHDHLTPQSDTYQKVIDTLHLIEQEIPSRWLAIRINFDNHTLSKIDEIINEINFLDRKSCYVILKKVWQIEKGQVNTVLLYEAIQKFFDKKFLLDYYIMPKGHVCFAERKREVLFNYDGKIFKCSTISTFDSNNALGELNSSNGQVTWNKQKITKWFQNLLPDYCQQCKWFPACLGPCNKQLLLQKKEKICTFDAINMGNKEFLMYSFKYHLLKKELSVR